MTKHSDDIRRGLRNPTRYTAKVIIEKENEPRRLCPCSDGEWCRWAEVEPLVDELYVLRNKVEWLRQAEHLVIWDGERWQVRQQPCKGSIVQDPANRPFPF